MLVVALGVLSVVVLVVGVSFGWEEFEKYVTRRAVAERADEMIGLLELSPSLSSHRVVDQVRTFVNDNSIHRIDDEFRSYWKDSPQMMTMMVAKAKGQGPPPHMECSTRSNVMRSILTQLGYDTRSVSLYRASDSGYLSHTFLEVRHPEADRWEIQDPDYDIHWRLKGSDVRVSARDMLAAPLDEFEPCTEPGHCGWDLASREGIHVRTLYEYFSVVSVNDRDRGERPLYVNTRRFEWDKPHPTDNQALTYCDYMPKNCRDIVELVDSD